MWSNGERMHGHNENKSTYTPTLPVRSVSTNLMSPSFLGKAASVSPDANVVVRVIKIRVRLLKSGRKPNRRIIILFAKERKRANFRQEVLLSARILQTHAVGHVRQKGARSDELFRIFGLHSKQRARSVVGDSRENILICR